MSIEKNRTDGDRNSALSAYLPIDRRFAIARSEGLPDRMKGAALFADLSGFTLFTAELARELGSRRGAEILTQQLNRVYGALIDQVHLYHGSVVGFSGDAITCWFDNFEDNIDDLLEPSWRALTCALAMREIAASDEAFAMTPISDRRLKLKVAVTAGPVRRFSVGRPGYRVIDTLAGVTLDRLAISERQARQAEVVVDTWTWALLGHRINPVIERTLTGDAWVIVVDSLDKLAEPNPWPDPPTLSADVAGDWVLNPIIRRLSRGEGDYLSELRSATILFLRFSGIDYDIDDEAEGKLDDYVRWAQSVVYRNKGYLIALTIGDKGSYFQASFGTPVAYGGDSENAVAAALELRSSPGKFDFIEYVQIGISQGVTRTGSYGSLKRRTYGIHGNQVNIAAKLMSLARPGSILTLQSVARKVQGIAKIRDAGELSIGGIERPIPASEILGHREAPTTFKQRNGQAAIVGRREEIARFQEQLDFLERGKSSVAIVVGEAGIGKSRLTDVFVTAAQDRGVKSFVGSGNAIEQSKAYHAWRPIFFDVFNIKESDSLEDISDIVLRRVASDPQMVDRAPLLNSLLPTTLQENELTTSMSGEIRANNTGFLAVQLLETSRNDQEPIIIILEDAHWLDSASWALADHVRKGIENLLLVIVTRPFDQKANGQNIPEAYKKAASSPDTIKYDLQYMTQEEAITLVRQRLGVDKISKSIRDLILQKAEGHPFFTEELAYALRDRGITDIEGDRLIVSPEADLSDLEFPDTIQGIITSRIDQLDPGQELTLKIASVIGRIFLFRTLRQIHPIEEDRPNLDSYMKSLARLDITPTESLNPELTYIFKHAITQEVAYSLLLFSQRRALHRAVGRWYEVNHSEDLDRFYPLLSYHWSKGRNAPRSVYYLEASGEQALRNYANQEAVQFFKEALSLSQGQPYLTDQFDRPMDDARRSSWLGYLGAAYLGLGQLVESRNSLLKMLELAGRRAPEERGRLIAALIKQIFVQIGHRTWPSLLKGNDKGKEAENYLGAARAYQHLAEIYYFANERAKTLHAGLTVLNLAERVSPSPELARAYANMVVIAGLIPWHSAAEAYGRRALETADEVGDLSARAWTNLLVSTYKIGIGEWDRVTELANRAIELCHQLGDLRVHGLSLGLLTLVPCWRGRFRESHELYVRWYNVAMEGNNVQHQAFGLFGQEENLLPQNKAEEAVVLVEDGLNLLTEKAERSFENRTAEIRGFGVLALARLRQGNYRGALEAADKAMEVVDLLSTPTRVTLLEGLSGAAEVYLSLMEKEQSGSEKIHQVKGKAKKAVKVMAQYTRVFTIGQPRTALWKGVYEIQSGRSAKAWKTWEKGLAAADRLEMIYDQALISWQMGKSGLRPNSSKFKSRAEAAFSSLGIDYPHSENYSADARKRGGS